MPLDDTTIDSLRRQLDAREAELQREVREVDADDDAPSKNPHNQVEDAGELGEQERRETVRHAERERDIEELRQIEAARQRIAQGSYGECIDCGRDIPLARLQVQPWSARCAPCQTQAEKHPPTAQASSVPRARP
ncbi:TraR/DksA family transcriptional regulator [Aquabacterium humicola]|uniref:TraR/DksA family transcriptional regulator n=1 Tax=Aquabacterium humicola TaxID=3237377 RepID=UPI002542752E|nr:TraR/DksA family transcriptional regulator [Rubrivivax pictus]